MPNIKSAKKRLRQNIKSRAANRQKTAKMRTEVKKAQVTISEGKLEEAKTQLSLAFQNVDKVAKKNIIHPNKAARMKSKLARKLNESAKK